MTTNNAPVLNNLDTTASKPPQAQVTLTPLINGNNPHQNHSMMEANPVPAPQIQHLAARQMENMNPSLKQYKEYQLQQQVNALNAQQSDTDAHDPSDLDNTNLYVKGLWKDCTQIELDDIFKQFGVISQSRVYGDGVGFVRFEKGHEAKAALEQMNGAKMDRCQDPLLVKYAFRKQKNQKRYIRVGDEVKQYEVEMIMNKNTNNVYLRCLPRNYTEPKLTALCTPYGELTCTRLRESGVAFVRYRRSEDAQKAIRGLNGRRFENHNETLLAKLANSDPFQPKIDFKQRNDDKEAARLAASQAQNNDVNNSQYSSNTPRQTQQQQQPPQHTSSHHTPRHSAPEHHYQSNHTQYNPQQAPQAHNNHHNPYEQQQAPPQQPGAHPQHAPHQHPQYQNQYDRIPPHIGGPPQPQYPPLQQAPPNPYIAPQHYGHPPPAHAPYVDPHNPPPQNIPPYAQNHGAYPPYGAPPQQAVPPYGAPQPPPYGYEQPPNAQQQAAVLPYAVQPVPYYTYYGGYGAYPQQYVVHPPPQQQAVPPQQAQQAQHIQQQQPPPIHQQQQQHQQQPPPQQQGPIIVSPPQSTATQPQQSTSTQPATQLLIQAPQVMQPTNSLTGLTGAPVYVPQPGAAKPVMKEVASKVVSPKSTNAPRTTVVLSSGLTANAVVYEPDITPPPDITMSELSFRHQGAMDLNMIGLKIQAQAAPVNSGQSNIAIPATPTLPELQQMVDEKQTIPLQIVDEIVDSKHDGELNNAQQDIVPALPERTNGSTTVHSLGDLEKMDKKKSNPHNVSKHFANKLHEVISTWHPQQAGKLTGMFLQNHDEEKVIKYLGRQDRLRKKIDAFVSLLSKPPAQNNQT